MVFPILKVVSANDTVEDSESKTIREVLQGKTEHFEALVNNHQNSVLCLVMHQVGHPELAEELTQEIFVKAYVGLPSFRFECSFATWITRIALNHTNSYFSSRSYKETRRNLSFDAEKHAAAHEPLAEHEKQTSLSDQLRDALTYLSPQLREVLALCALEGKSYEEAAAILGIPLGTVRSRLSKARRRLKLSMGREAQT